MGKVEVTVTDEYGNKSGPFAYYFFPTMFEIETIVKIVAVNRHDFSEEQVQVDMDALALDGLGFVFKVDLFFYYTAKEADDLVARVTEGSILQAKGVYSVLEEDPQQISLYDPVLTPFDPDVPVENLEMVFSSNVR